jgi:hypothetical protein
MSWPAPGWATASFYGLIASILLILALVAFMCYCYYPGGRHRSDVIDIGELPKYMLSGAKPYEEELYDEQRSEYTGPSDTEYYSEGGRGQVRFFNHLSSRTIYYLVHKPCRSLIYVVFLLVCV